jgi:predicted dehydrogenase
MIRWGLIGVGDIAEKRVAAALKDSRGSSLDAVTSARPERAAAFAARHGVARHYADWREMLKDGGLEAVYVATPVHLHPELAIAAAEAGKHVLCEKPMALDAADCGRMIAAARRHGVRLGVAYYRHLYPVVLRMKQILEAATIGRPVLVHAQAFERFDVAPDHPRAWFLRKADAGGGPMFDFGCHRIEVLLSLLGPVERVSGGSTNVQFKAREVEDTCVAHFVFASGAQAVLAVSHAAGAPRDSFEIVGTEGSVHVPVLNLGRLRLVTADGETEENHPPHANLHLPLVQDFVDALREGREPAVTGEQGQAEAHALDAIYAGPRG